MFIGYKQQEGQSNLGGIEGIGAQYQKIISLLCVAKRHNLKFIYTRPKIGDNKLNLKDWDEKWEKMFNIKKLCNNDEINDNINSLEKKYNISLTSSALSLNNDNNKILNLYLHAFEIFDSNPDFYLSNIQNDLINAYDENNIDRKLIYDKNKINIAIHIRVFSDFDLNDELNNYKLNITPRFYMTCDKYIKIINDLKIKYPNSDIHIFSQEKYFDLNYKKIRDIEGIKLHFDDLDTFDTIHHLCKADVLLMGLSSFSILAAFYNKNTVIYLPYYHPPSLKSWKLLKFI